MTAVSLATAVLGVSGDAHAEQGRLEIDQTCAVLTGCFPGDTPGFPVTVDTGGSYVLSSNLVVAQPGTAAVFANTGDFTLDLDGFALIGPVTCSNVDHVTTCTGNSGSGVAAGNDANVEVRNGFVKGFGFNGIAVGDSGRVHDVTVAENGKRGISAGANAVVTDVVVELSAGTAIYVGTGSVVERAAVGLSSYDGVYAGGRSTITSVFTTTHGDDGIQAGTGSVVRGNLSRDNGYTGIEADTAVLVADNYSTLNGAAGIRVGDASSVRRNLVSTNEGVGINFAVGTSSSYRENALENNDGGSTAGTGIDLGSNHQ